MSHRLGDALIMAMEQIKEADLGMQKNAKGFLLPAILAAGIGIPAIIAKLEKDKRVAAQQAAELTLQSIGPYLASLGPRGAIDLPSHLT